MNIFFTIFVLFFGILTSWHLNYKWILIATVLHSVPFLFQFSKNKLVKVYFLWFGIFLIIQSLISPFIINKLLKSDYHTLPPNINIVRDVRVGIPGISGFQYITTDSEGFRTTKNINYLKKNDAYRIFAIGASTTEQIDLDDHKIWTHLLQEKLDKYFKFNIEVINTGLSGLRARHHFATLKKISKYYPNMVIILTGINDWNQHIKVFFDRYKFLPFDNSLMGKSLEKIYMLLKFRNINKLKNDSQKRFLSNFQITYGEFYTKRRNSLFRDKKVTFKPKKVLSEYIHYLNEIISFCEMKNITCVFLTQPIGYQDISTKDFRKGFWMTPPNAEYTLDFESLIYIAELYNNFLIDFTNKKGVYVFDLSKKIPPSYDYMIDDCHYNVNGAKKVSEVLFEFLKPIISEIKMANCK